MLKPPYDMLYSIGVKTGLRISDLLRIKPEFLRGRVLTVFEQKTGNKRTCYVTEKQRKYIKSFSEGECVFKMSRQAVYKYFRSVSSALGLSRVGTHSMRKKFCKNFDGSVLDLQQELGHKFVSTTALYLLSQRDFEKTTECGQKKA